MTAWQLGVEFFGLLAWGSVIPEGVQSLRADGACQSVIADLIDWAGGRGPLRRSVAPSLVARRADDLTSVGVRQLLPAPQQRAVGGHPALARLATAPHFTDPAQGMAHSQEDFSGRPGVAGLTSCSQRQT